MRWLPALLAHLGSDGAHANASRALADEREIAAQLDRFLLRFDHPAGINRRPAEPVIAEETQVA